MFTIIRLNDQNESVALLRVIFGLSGAVFDTDLQQRVLIFQKNAGLKADGIVGANTWGALAKSLSTISQNSKTHPHVKVLQLILGGLDVDGIFGSKTKSHVLAFQKAANLTPDGVVGPKTWGALFSPSAPESVVTNPVDEKTATFIKPTDFKQGDSRWGKNNYTSTNNKSQTMANSGCGPTAAADVIHFFKDQSVNPWTLALLAMKWGHRTANSGTAWAFFKKVAEQYKCSKFQQTTSLATVLAALNNGALVVCSMGPPFWTKGGHFITLWKFDTSTMFANDPASTSRKSQNRTDFHAQCKQYFIFYK